jgi:hypothetical protein
MVHNMKYHVWECKIVVRGDAELPDGFDMPPRRAAIKAVESHGIDVVCCYSGWGDSLTDSQRGICDDFAVTQDALKAAEQGGEG